MNEIRLADSYKKRLGKCCIDPLRPPPYRVKFPDTDNAVSQALSGLGGGLLTDCPLFITHQVFDRVNSADPPCYYAQAQNWERIRFWR